MILRGTSPIPIGLTPGHLSSGIRRHITRALSPSGLTLVVAIRRATLASAEHKPVEHDLNEEQSLLQACASSPEGPAEPWVRRDVCLIVSASRPSKVIGFTTSGTPSNRERESGCLPMGCFSFRTSLVDRSMDSPFGNIITLRNTLSYVGVFVVNGAGARYRFAQK